MDILSTFFFTSGNFIKIEYLYTILCKISEKAEKCDLNVYAR